MLTPPWYILLDYFTTRPSLTNLNEAFLSKWCKKCINIFEKHPLVAELKLKISHIALFFMFSISALPPDGAFQMFIHF